MRTLSIVIALLSAAHLGLQFVHPIGLAAEADQTVGNARHSVAVRANDPPCVLTIIALAGVVGTSTPPAALGRAE